MAAKFKPKPGQTTSDFLARLNREDYERYLKRNHYHGLAAARMDMKQREGIRALDTTTLLLSS